MVREALRGTRRFSDSPKGRGGSKSPDLEGSAYSEDHLTEKGRRLRLVLDEDDIRIVLGKPSRSRP